MNQALFDPDSSLRFLIVRHVHALGGTCFGRVVRSFFLHSGEPHPEIDCFFHKTQIAEIFLAVLGVEHKVNLLHRRVFGTNSYRVTRPMNNGFECAVNINIVAYYQGLTRRGHLPRNIAFPMFDIDHVFWDRNAIVAKRAEPSRDGADLSLAHLLERCVRRQFAPTNALAKRQPAALALMLHKAQELVSMGFTMDDACGAKLPIVEKSRDPTLQCCVMRKLVPQDQFIVRLPCSHVLSLDGMLRLTCSDNTEVVNCPTCKCNICSRNPLAEGIL